MTLTSTLALISIAGYLICTAIKHKEIPDSISETAYIVDKPEVFTGVMFTEACLLMFPLLEHSSENTQWLAFLTIAGLIMVALTPKYKTEGGIAHYIGGMITGVASQALIAANEPTILYSWATYPLLYFISKEDYTYWAELICLINIFIFIL